MGQVLAMSIVLAAVGGGAPVEPAVAGDAADRAELEPDAAEKARLLKFEAKPQSFQMNSYIYFDEAGKIRNEQHNCNFSFRVSYDPSVTPVSYDNLEVERIVTNTGDKLKAPDHHSHRGDLTHYLQNPNRPDHFNVSISLPYPPRDATSLEEVSGTMDVQCGVGPLKEAKVGPFKDIKGKRIRIAGLDDNVRLMVREENNNRLKIEYPRSAQPWIARIAVLTAGGAEIKSNGWGSGSSGDKVYRYLHLKMPADGQIKLSLFSKVETVEFPFAIWDIPLPFKAAERESDEIVIEAKPAGARAKPGADGEAEEDPLEIIVDK